MECWVLWGLLGFRFSFYFTLLLPLSFLTFLCPWSSTFHKAEDISNIVFVFCCGWLLVGDRATLKSPGCIWTCNNLHRSPSAGGTGVDHHIQLCNYRLNSYLSFELCEITCLSSWVLLLLIYGLTKSGTFYPLSYRFIYKYFIFLLDFWDRVLLCNPGWPQIHNHPN